ncbi:MAG: RDD family protein, partial [Acidobacteria bacterium]|nr:RDD family protein [Acidobacteriota bacterium]
LQPKAIAPAAKTLDGGGGAATTATAEVTADKPQPRRVAGVIDDHWLERSGVETLPKVETVELTYDDRAPHSRRFVAAVLDLLIVTFLSAPFAAVIELTIGNWGDPRVWASMSGIVFIVMFLYLTCSLALASRTLGMKLFSMHAVHADTAHAPTTAQCARRALVYMISLLTFGLGILYAFFDAEGRTAHDLFSRTVVVKK